jgi:PAS domain S-box-containing protein
MALTSIAALAGKADDDCRRIVDAVPVAMYATDVNGIITYYNPAAAEFWGREPVMGKDHWSQGWRILDGDGKPVSPEDYPMSTVLKEHRPVHDFEGFSERPDGRRTAFTPLPTPLFNTKGEFTGAVSVLVDITERRKAQDDLRKRLDESREIAMLKSHLAGIVESSDDAIISKNFFGIITSWNAAAERIYGYAADEAIGKHISIVVPFDHQDEEYDIIDRLRRGERIDHFQTVRRAKDGRLLNVSISVSPVRDADGKVIGAAKVARLLPD